jgi:type II secretory pathway predicted ATPase ExeA
MLAIYCKHYGLTREPFNVTPDPNFLYLSPSHREALAQFVYGIKSRRGFVVLTGEVGTGKTTLIHGLLEEINDGHTHTALIFNLIGSPKDFLRCLCEELAITSPLERLDDIQDHLTVLNQFLLECYRKGDNVVLIIDEAQNLSAEVLERVRLLSNFETEQQKLLQILLVGQPELGDRLNQSELRQLKQRVALRHHLSPLNLTECKEYISRRLEISGGKISLFSTAAINAVHTYSGGIPRLVNIMCDNGLLSAYAQRKERVEAGMIDEIAQELEITVSAQQIAAPHHNNNGDSDNVRTKVESLLFSKPVSKIWSRSDMPIAEQNMFLETQLLGPKPIPRDGLSLTASLEGTAARLDYIKESQNGSAKKFETLSGFVPSLFFESMTRALTECFGPMAAIIIDDHIAAMGETKEAFPKRRIGQLVDEISVEILNESMKGQFHQIISEELHGMVVGEENRIA